VFRGLPLVQLAMGIGSPFIVILVRSLIDFTSWFLESNFPHYDSPRNREKEGSARVSETSRGNEFTFMLCVRVLHDGPVNSRLATRLLCQQPESISTVTFPQSGAAGRGFPGVLTKEIRWYYKPFFRAYEV